MECKIIAVCKLNISNSKIENIIIKEDYIYIKDEIDKIIKDRIDVFMSEIKLKWLKLFHNKLCKKIEI